jgi:hypothetical protein
MSILVSLVAKSEQPTLVQYRAREQAAGSAGNRLLMCAVVYQCTNPGCSDLEQRCGCQILNDYL